MSPADIEPCLKAGAKAFTHLVGATTPIAKCMEILQERVGLTPDECRAVGHDNPLALIGLA